MFFFERHSHMGTQTTVKMSLRPTYFDLYRSKTAHGLDVLKNPMPNNRGSNAKFAKTLEFCRVGEDITRNKFILNSFASKFLCNVLTKNIITIFELQIFLGCKYSPLQQRYFFSFRTNGWLQRLIRCPNNQRCFLVISIGNQWIYAATVFDKTRLFQLETEEEFYKEKS